MRVPEIRTHFQCGFCGESLEYVVPLPPGPEQGVPAGSGSGTVPAPFFAVRGGTARIERCPNPACDEPLPKLLR